MPEWLPTVALLAVLALLLALLFPLLMFIVPVTFVLMGESDSWGLRIVCSGVLLLAVAAVAAVTVLFLIQCVHLIPLFAVGGAS